MRLTPRMSTYRLDRLVAPRSIALVGGSPRERSLGRVVFRNLRAAGFAGPLHVVNPHHDEIDGVATVKDFQALPGAPDIIVVTAPAAAVPDIVAKAGALGTAGAVVISGGLGQGPGSLAEAAAGRAREHGIRLLGPNGLGIIVPRAKLNASFAARMPASGRPDGHLAVRRDHGRPCLVGCAAQYRLCRIGFDRGCN